MLLSLSSGANSFVQLITVLIIFVFVLAVTYFTTRWIANYQKAKLTSGNIDIIETYRLTQNKYVQIIRVGEKYVAIAVCKDTVEVLTELTENQLIIPEVRQEMPLNFKEILEKAKNLKTKK